jgi:hypothetical protein
MDPDKATAAFPVLEERIRQTLVAHDPSGLFELGAPRDEHDGDVHTIISRLQRASDETEVPGILEDALGHWIGDRRRVQRKVCEAMAPEVWDAWSAFKVEAG